MSNYTDKAFNPVSGRIEGASWLDDHFGPHAYGVRFENEDHVYRPDEVALEKANEMIAALKAKLAECESEINNLLETASELEAIAKNISPTLQVYPALTLDNIARRIRALSTKREEG